MILDFTVGSGVWVMRAISLGRGQHIQRLFHGQGAFNQIIRQWRWVWYLYVLNVLCLNGPLKSEKVQAFVVGNGKNPAFEPAPRIDGLDILNDRQKCLLGDVIGILLVAKGFLNVAKDSGIPSSNQKLQRVPIAVFDTFD